MKKIYRMFFILRGYSFFIPFIIQGNYAVESLVNNNAYDNQVRFGLTDDQLQEKERERLAHVSKKVEALTWQEWQEMDPEEQREKIEHEFYVKE